MDYRKMGGTVYIRIDRGDEIISSILEICRKERIRSAVYSGIGGCNEAQIQTFDPEKKAFATRTLKGMLELVSMTGNIFTDENGNQFRFTPGKTWVYVLDQDKEFSYE